MTPVSARVDAAMRMEHRWGKREPTNVAVNFVVYGTTGAGRVLNVSLTGAYLETSIPPRLLSVIYLQLARTASAAAERIAATVVRRDPWGVGLEWSESETETRRGHARLVILSGDTGNLMTAPPSVLRTAISRHDILDRPG
jgi:PilZ domain